MAVLTRAAAGDLRSVYRFVYRRMAGCVHRTEFSALHAVFYPADGTAIHADQKI